jgi:hypothetical protein
VAPLRPTPLQILAVCVECGPPLTWRALRKLFGVEKPTNRGASDTQFFGDGTLGETAAIRLPDRLIQRPPLPPPLFAFALVLIQLR